MISVNNCLRTSLVSPRSSSVPNLELKATKRVVMPYSSAGRFVIGAAVCGLQPGSYRVVVGNHRTGGNNGWEEAVEKGPNETGYLEIQAPAHWRATDTITVTFYPAKSRWDAAPLAQVTLPGQDTKHISSYGFEAKRDESTLKASVFLQAIRRAP